VFDIGGTSIKAQQFDSIGRRRGGLWRADTPRPATPATVLRVLCELARSSGPFDRVAVGFPGVVRDGVVRTAPNLAPSVWRGRGFARDVTRVLGKPTRVANDAVLHGLGATRGRGVELLLTLGTGLGSVLLVGGHPLPMELGHLPWRDGRTYEQCLGEAGRCRVGTRRWRQLVASAVQTLARAVEADAILLGGGNAARLRGYAPPRVRLVENRAALVGGSRLWTLSLQIAKRYRIVGTSSRQPG